MSKPVNRNINEAYKRAKENLRKKMNSSGDSTLGDRVLKDYDREKNIPKGNAFERARQSQIPALDRSGVIYQNGFDSHDTKTYTRDRKEYDRRAGALITTNLIKAAEQRKRNRKK